MEAKVLEAVVVRCTLIRSLVFRFESLVRFTQCIQIDLDGLVTVNGWVLNMRIWFVKVVSVVHERASDIVKDNWSIRSDQHGNASSSTGWTSASFGVHCYVR